MSKIYNYFICIFLLCISCNSGISKNDIVSITKSIDTVKISVKNIPLINIERRKTLQEIYTSQIGVREKTGKNDGEDVEKYLSSVNLGKGYSWCAAFVYWCLNEAGYKTRITGWSPSTFNKNNIVYFMGKKNKDLIAGDVFSLYFERLGRIGHTGFYDKAINSSIYESVEGNTNEAGSREGDGVYRKKRSFNATYSITRWTE